MLPTVKLRCQNCRRIFIIYHKSRFHFHQPISTRAKVNLHETKVKINLIHTINQEQKLGPQNLELKEICIVSLVVKLSLARS